MASRLVRVNPVTVNDVLDGHVQLNLECPDRVYLNGYLARVQVGGQVVQFLRHRGFPVPSPACLQQIGDAFRRSVASYADANHIPMVRLKSTDRNIVLMRRYLDSAARQRRSQVAAIGVAQEPQRVFIARQRDTDPTKPPQFSFDKKDRRVTVFYFYLWDADFGPAFVKVCTYCPWPIKVWVNGHEWAKRHATQAGLEFTELSNGFATCEDPETLQGICDRLGPGPINVFFQRWLSRLPLPLTPADAHAGDRWNCRWRRSRSPAPSSSLPPACPRFLRGPARRQPRPRPPGHHRDRFRPPDPRRQTRPRRTVQDQARYPRHRGHHQRLLPPLPHQTIFEGQPGVADRDGDQRAQ